MDDGAAGAARGFPKVPCWVITAALESELRGVYKLIEQRRRLPLARGSAYFGNLCGQPVLAVRTGMGRARALEVCGSVLARFPARALVSIGYAGSLRPGIGVGDIVVARELVVAAEDGPLVFRSEPALVARASRGILPGGGCTVVVDRTLTTDRVIVSSKEKRRLGASYSAAGVDMESGFLAGLAAREGIPFVAVRCISDDAATELPDYNTLLALRRKRRYVAILWYLASHPREAVGMVRLRHGAALASKNLARFIEGFWRDMGAGDGLDPGAT